MSIMGSGEAVQYALLLAVILANAPGTRLCLTESERLSLRCDQCTVQMSSANWRLRSEPRRRESALLCCRARFGWRPHRKRDREHRAATRGRRGFDVASVLAEHGLADAQSEASATAGPLGGKERIKNVRQVFRGDSRSVILKDDPYRGGVSSHAHANRVLLPALAGCLRRHQQEGPGEPHQPNLIG